MHYCADVNMAFTSAVHITGDVNYGFILRYILHANALCFGGVILTYRNLHCKLWADERYQKQVYLHMYNELKFHQKYILYQISIGYYYAA